MIFRKNHSYRLILVKLIFHILRHQTTENVVRIFLQKREVNEEIISKVIQGVS